jgi:hypothetical protein
VKRKTNIFVLLSIAGILTCLCSGCIILKSGNGPLSLKQATLLYGNQLENLSEEEQMGFKKIEEITSSDKKHKLPFGRFYIAGSPKITGEGNVSGRASAKLTCGFKNSKVRYVNTISEVEESVKLYTIESICAPGYPLIWPLWFNGDKTYLAETDKQIAENSLFGLVFGILGGSYKRISPDYSKGQVVQNISNPEEYNVLKMKWLLAGILGYGQVNNKKYGQFLWTAFPMGDVK